MATAVESCAEAQVYLSSLFDKILTKDGVPAGKLLFSSLEESLRVPPLTTTLRANTLHYTRDQVTSHLTTLLQREKSPVTVLSHPDLPELVALSVEAPSTRPPLQEKRLVVGLACGNAVLRGANVYAPGVMAAPKSLVKGDCVSVFSDLEGRCLKGTAVDYPGKTMFVGNGVAEMSREELFGSNRCERGCAVRMVDSVYGSPSLSDEECGDMVFLQNLPSLVTARVLDPQPGERVLDTCAAPGGKTVHIGALMNNVGSLIALDKSMRKVQKLQANLDRFKITCAQCFKFDATRAVATDDHRNDDSPPYVKGSFDRVLVDAPCSALGQRPQAAVGLSVKELCSYPHYQRMILKQAVSLLKPGGVLVYSTCSYSPEENECQVAWLLREFKNLILLKQTPHFGHGGLPGFGLSQEDTAKLQRFWPLQFSLALETHVDTLVPEHKPILLDTIGFFIAKFTLVSE